MNGRAPGFASFVLYLPVDHMTVIVFSNIYSSATTAIGYDIAAICLGLPYATFQPASAVPDAQLRAVTGTFKFGADFYHPNAKVSLVKGGAELSMQWPSGDVSPLIPLREPGHFIDRAYWEDVRIETGKDGQPITLVFGEFRGSAVNNTP